MARVALAHSNPRFACVGRPGRRGTLRGRRGIWQHGQSICVAGLALGDIHLDFGMAGVALAHINPLFCVAGVAIIAGSGGTLGRLGRRDTLRSRRLATPTFVLRGRRGAYYGTGLGWLWWRGGVGGRRGTPSPHARLRPVSRPWRRGTFAWQAWHLVTSTVTLHGRRGTWRHAWTLVLRGRSGTETSTIINLRFACVALGDIDANTPTSTQTSFTQTSFIQNLEHTSLLNSVKGNSFTHKLEHTLAQKYLIELLMWNASHVQKQFS